MKTNVGFIGLGGRGRGLLKTLLVMDDVEVKVICDHHPERLEAGREVCREQKREGIDAVSDSRKVMQRDDIECVVIGTSWNAHIPLAIAAMRSGKYAGFEVGPAQNLEQCMDLVRTYEETGVPCMLLENCDYGRTELALLNMIRKGIFGELIHCQAGYGHDLRGLAKRIDIGHERSFHNLRRNGDMYMTHGIGPVMNNLGINRGNRMLTLTSMASKQRGLSLAYAAEHGKHLDFNMGDIITTMIRCANGETVLVTHDVSLPRPYSRAGRVQGTRGLWLEDGGLIYLDGRSPEHKWEKFEQYMEEYDHPLWKKKDQYEQFGHGGMDYLVLRAFLQSVREGTQTPIDVYDSATMMALSVLSEMSIAQGSAPLSIPDYTSGQWVRPRPAPKSIYSLDEVHHDLFTGDIAL